MTATPIPAGGHGCGCPEGVAAQTAAQGAALSRRSFLRGAAAVGALVAMSSVDTRMAFAATPADGDVLVVLSLRGGFDGLSAVVPAADPAYAAARPTVGIPASVLLPLDATFGLHPALAPLMPLWRAGTFGVVHAVGQASPSRSHFAAMEEMERAAPGTGLRTGWIDRALGVSGPGGSGPATPLAGMQVGSSMASSGFLGPQPEVALRDLAGFSLNGAWDDVERSRWYTALRELHAGSPAPVAAPTSAALSALASVAAVRAGATPPASGATYPDSDLGRALRDLAIVVKARVGLRTAAVDYGDWDMHAGMGSVDSGWLRNRLSDLAASLAAFATDLGPHLARTTVVTLSEFGRRVAQNDSGGVDHGHGNAVLLLGGAVRGGRVHGRWPGLAPSALVAGDLAGTTDYRQIVAEVLTRRLGVAAVGDVFPGLSPAPLGVVAPKA